MDNNSARIDTSSIELSFKHFYQINKVYKNALGMYDIEHISLDLVSPDNYMTFLSATPMHAFEICRQGYGNYDGIIDREYYENNEFYWWEDAHHKNYAERIKQIRHRKLKLQNGFMLVRHIDNFYLIYSFATKSNHHGFKESIRNNLNEIFSMGDWCYNELRHLYQDECPNYTVPEINQFIPFKGGRPEHVSTHTVTPSNKENKSNIILLNSSKRRKP